MAYLKSSKLLADELYVILTADKGSFSEVLDKAAEKIEEERIYWRQQFAKEAAEKLRVNARVDGDDSLEFAADIVEALARPKQEESLAACNHQEAEYGQEYAVCSRCWKYLPKLPPANEAFAKINADLNAIQRGELRTETVLTDHGGGHVSIKSVTHDRRTYGPLIEQQGSFVRVKIPLWPPVTCKHDRHPPFPGEPCPDCGELVKL